MPWDQITLGGSAVVTFVIQLLKRQGILKTTAEKNWATIILGAVVMLFAKFVADPSVPITTEAVSVVTAILASHGVYQLILNSTSGSSSKDPTPASPSSAPSPSSSSSA